MGSPYLNSNEAIVLSTHNVIINTIPAEAILTSQRLILIDARHTEIRPQDIPFSALETVTIGDTTAMDPVISLSIVLKDETRHTLGMVFPQAPRMRRVGERDDWATKLKEASMTAQQEVGIKPADLVPPWVPGEIPENEEAGGKGAEAPEGKFYNPPLAPRKSRKQPPSGRQRTITLTALAIIAVIACIAGVYFLAPALPGNLKIPGIPAPVAGPTVTPAETPSVTEQATVIPSPTIIPEMVVSPTVTVVPETTREILPQATGVWVKIDYPGNFTATYGTAGRMREVSGSGSQIYQVPAKDEIVDAIVVKHDESGDKLTVSILNNGIVAKSGSTVNPHGTVEIHADLRNSA